MTTSDDEPDTAAEETTHAEPFDGDVSPAYGDDLAPVAASTGRGWGLAILAAVGATVVGVVLWALIYVQFEREYIGVSVLIGLAVGWLIRVLSGRSNLTARLIAVVITAIACVVGTVVGQAAFNATAPQIQFWEELGDKAPEWLDTLQDRERPAQTYAIFAAALVLAYLSAGPQSPSKKQKKAMATPAAEPAAIDDPMARDPLADDVPPPPADDED